MTITRAGCHELESLGRFQLMAESVSHQYDRGRFSFQVEAIQLQPETIAL
jgi:hypothetical protein